MPGPGKICLGPGNVQSIVRSQVSCGHEINIQVGLKDGICDRKQPQKHSQSVYFENWVYAQVL